MMKAKDVLQNILDAVKTCETKRSVVEATEKSLGLGNISVGSKVAVLDDPTFPLAGLTGTVKSINAQSGTALCRFVNGTEVNCLVNQLLAL